MSMERVLGEIDYAGKHKIQMLGFCDANFGILPRDPDIARFIVETKEKYGYPREVGYTNAKTASSRLTDIIKVLSDGGLISSGQISMQTTDETILENVQRSNIKMSEYQKMITFFHKEDIPAVSDIMLGLPGQTFETCKKDLQFCFDHKVTAMLFATSVMPNAPMNDEEYRRKFQIVIGNDGFVESTYSFTREEYGRMFDLCLAYKLFVKLGLLKYLLYYVQLEHGVLAMDFLARWLTLSVERADQYPISARVRRVLIDRDRTAGLKDWILVFWSDEQARFLFDAWKTSTSRSRGCSRRSTACPWTAATRRPCSRPTARSCRGRAGRCRRASISTTMSPRTSHRCGTCPAWTRALTTTSRSSSAVPDTSTCGPRHP